MSSITSSSQTDRSFQIRQILGKNTNRLQMTVISTFSTIFIKHVLSKFSLPANFAGILILTNISFGVGMRTKPSPDAQIPLRNTYLMRIKILLEFFPDKLTRLNEGLLSTPVQINILKICIWLNTQVCIK